MACNCSKGRTTASGVAAVSGTYRVMVGGHKVYETSNEAAAQTVADRFESATVLKPGETG